MIATDAIPAVAYLRRSTDMQERSIPDQRAYVAKWASEHGYRVTAEYVDDAISGTSAKGRTGFERMIADAERGAAFKAVLCYDISRFSRGGTNETGFWLHRLQMAGVDALFCAEGIPEGDEGELLQGVKSWQARQFSVKLSRDTIRGTVSHITEKRCAPGGMPPFGYDKQHRSASGQVLRTFRWMPDGSKHEFGPDGSLLRSLAPGEMVKKAKSDLVLYVPSTPERVALVRRIFRSCADGLGYLAIAARLNDEGIASADGGHWTSGQIGRIVRNDAYRGAVVWNRRTVGRINGVGRDGKLRPKKGRSLGTNPVADWFTVEDAHEPLVDATLFARASRAVAGRRDVRCPVRPERHALLAGLIRCTRCGHGFVQKRVRSKSGNEMRSYRYYTDGGYNRGGKAVCALTNVPADALDAWVLGRVRDVLIADEGSVAAAIGAFVKMAKSPREPVETRDPSRELAAIDKRIRAMATMLADPSFEGLDEIKTTLADLKRRRDALRTEATRIAEAKHVMIDEGDLRRWAKERFESFARAAQSGVATAALAGVVRAYVDRIEIDPKSRRGVLWLPADAMACLRRETACNSGAHRDYIRTPNSTASRSLNPNLR